MVSDLFVGGILFDVCFLVFMFSIVKYELFFRGFLVNLKLGEWFFVLLGS